MNHRHLFIRFRHKFYFLVRYLTQWEFRKRRTLGKGGVWTIHFCLHNADLALLSHRNERFCLELRDLRFAEPIRHSHFFLVQSWFEFNRFYNYNFRCKFGLIWHPLLEICPQPGCSGSVSSIFKKKYDYARSYTNHIHQKYDYALVRTHNKRNWKPDLRKHIITLNLSMILPLFTRNFSQWMASVNFFIRTSKQ